MKTADLIYNNYVAGFCTAYEILRRQAEANKLQRELEDERE